ncbi:hypothetical protein EMCRGX_G021971 [Ephydatia muelleri]
MFINWLATAAGGINLITIFHIRKRCQHRGSDQLMVCMYLNSDANSLLSSEKFLSKKGQESGKNGKILARLLCSWPR